MSRYNEIIDNIMPETSNAELFAEVKSSARIRRIYKKRVTALWIAAAAVTMLAVTVLAYDMGLVDSVRAFFGDKKNIISENINGVNIIACENNFDTLDISVSGAVRDDVFTVIFIDIFRRDGKNFDTSDYILTDKVGTEMVMSDGEKCVLHPSVSFMSDRSRSITSNGIEFTEASRCYLVNDDDTTDNRITLAYCIPDFNYNAFGTFRLDLENLNIESHYGIMSGEIIYLHGKDKESFNGNFLCEIDMSGITSISDVKTIYPDSDADIPVLDRSSAKPDEPEMRTFTVKEISVSGITVKLKMEGKRMTDTEYVQTYGIEGIGRIILKDGTTLTFGNEILPQMIIDHSDGDVRLFDGSFVLPRAVDVEDIAEIVVGRSHFEIK